MALHFAIKINSDPVAAVYVQRLHDGIRPVCRYRVEASMPDGRYARTEIEHTYDDGPVVLAYKALAALIQQTDPSLVERPPLA